jgi:hypothetical protein
MELVSCNMPEGSPFSCFWWQMLESVSDDMTMQAFKQCSSSSPRMYLTCQLCVFRFYAARHSPLKIEDLVVWTVWRLNLHIWNASLSLWFICLEVKAGRLEMQLQPDAEHHSRVSAILVRTTPASAPSAACSASSSPARRWFVGMHTEMPRLN